MIERRNHVRPKNPMPRDQARTHRPGDQQIRPQASSARGAAMSFNAALQLVVVIVDVSTCQPSAVLFIRPRLNYVKSGPEGPLALLLYYRA